MAKGKLKIIGVTFSISFLAFISLAVFIKAIGVIFNDFFVEHAVIIALVSGGLVAIGLISGAISLGSLVSKGKSIF